ISAFTLQQGAPSKSLPTLREQRVQVATFKLDGGLTSLQTVPVTYKGASTRVPGLVGTACPDLVYPNYQDWGFVKVQLDKRSFETARGNLAKVDDALLRTMLWQSLWDGVRDGKLPLNEFIKTALVNAPLEKDYTLLGDVLGKVGLAREYLDLMGLRSAYATQTRSALEDMAWNGVLASKGNDNFQRRWFSSYVNLASSPAALDRLAGIVDGNGTVEGLAINQDLRWAIIRQLNRHDHAGSAARIDAELKRDNSDAGQAAALAATVSRPDPAVKAQWLGTVEDLKTELPFSKVRTAMGNLYPAGQNGLGEATAARRLAQLPGLDKAAGPVYMRAYANSLIPASCTPASVKRLDGAVARMKELSAGTRRALLDAQQEDQRCVSIKQAMTAAK
ncbi:MAG: ERAP1-like C-terminal domain-containing protein, partial [Telluria sp.]